MVYFIVNQKGGVGKSSFASHILPEYILGKGKEDTVNFFEFDEYSQSSKDYLSNSELVEPTIIKEEDIREKIFSIDYDAETQDVIVDVGAGSLVSQIVSIAEESLSLDKLVFIIPYSDDAPSALLETIALIEETVDNPKILVALSKIIQTTFNLEESKKAAISLYGNVKYGIEPYEHLDKIDKYVKASIPYDHFVFTFAKADKASLVDLKKSYLAVKGLEYKELVELWRDIGKIEGETITREEHIRNKIAMQRHQKATKFLDDCSEFYAELEKLESRK